MNASAGIKPTAMNCVFVDCTAELDRVLQARGIRPPENVKVNVGDPDAPAVRRLCAARDTLLLEHTALPDDFFVTCPQVRRIVFMGTGAGSYVDLAQARARGVQVHTISGYGDQAVAEHALALTFAAARQLARMDRELRAGTWQPLQGLQLAGRKVAVIGLGGIGTAYARLAAALGMAVSGWSASPRADAWYEPDLDRALWRSDVVSLHLPLNADTNAILNATRLALPRRGFLLINTARALLVDQAALLAGLASGHIGHAALDVFETEPLRPDDPLLRHDRVTATAHAAYMTEDAYEALWQKAMALLSSTG
jgi:D-3-phosphoglycerate dehydrogenase / 2-oxoglutarate reductase